MYCFGCGTPELPSPSFYTNPPPSPRGTCHHHPRQPQAPRELMSMHSCHLWEWPSCSTRIHCIQRDATLVPVIALRATGVYAPCIRMHVITNTHTHTHTHTHTILCQALYHIFLQSAKCKFPWHAAAEMYTKQSPVICVAFQPICQSRNTQHITTDQGHTFCKR